MNKPLYRTNSRELTLLYHLVLVFVLMTCCRGIYYLYNYSYFSHISVSELGDAFLGGLLFDGASIFYTNALYFLLLLFGRFLPYRWETSRAFIGIRSTLYLLPNLLNIFVNISDTGYYPFVLKRTSMSIFSEFQNDNVFGLYSKYLVTFWPLTLLFFLLVGLLWVGYGMVRFERRPSHGGIGGWILKGFTLVEVGLLGLIGLMTIRGEVGFENRPMTTLRANNFVRKPQDRALVLNTTFTMLRTSRKASLPELQYFTQDEIAQYFNSVYKAQPLHEGDTLFGAFRDKNVVFIILESFAKEYSHYLNQEVSDYPTYMPFLDELMSRSLTFKYAFANGRTSIEAMPSGLTSLPALGINFVLSHYATNDLMSLPLQMDQAGYSTIFYHGAPKGSMGFDAFVKQIGIQDYFGKEQHGRDEDYDGTWGIFDDKFLQTVARHIGQRPSPFWATIFTLSSHAPYTIPEEYADQCQPGTQNIHRAVRYADIALRKFFDAIKDEPWYHDTLFVLMADHASQSDRPEYQNVGGRFAIPIIFHDPSSRLVGTEDRYVVQQADILPSLLYLMGDSTAVTSFGHNMFDPEADHFVVNYENDHHVLLHRDFTMTMDAAGSCVLTPSSPLVQCPLDYTPSDSIDTSWYEKVLKAYVQDYNHKVIHDALNLSKTQPPRR